MNPEQLIADLAEHVRAAVYPHLGALRARKITGTASSGDATFDIDDVAEEAIESFLRERDANVAYYSEDRGLVPIRDGQTPEGLLVIDPIDGTRGAIAGFEACVVSVAWTDVVKTPTMRDVRFAAIREIKGPLSVSAARGGGIRIRHVDGGIVQPTLLQTDVISDMPWSLELVGAPLHTIFDIIRDVANPTSVRGGFFVLNSSAYELTRLVTGQLAAVIDVRNRVLREMPAARPDFVKYGGGRLLCLYGYDVAAAALIAEEAGCTVTDAWGRTLDDWPLLDTTEGNFGSLIAASNASLHAQLLEAINAGFRR